MIRLEDNPDLQVRACEAMNTTFTLRLECPDTNRAADAAGACFNQLEELEAQLSRFRPDSDVSRINQLQAGESLFITESTHACLLQAAEASAQTAGLFDATLGSRTHPAPGQESLAPLCGRLEIAPDRPRVTCREPGRQIDLGGIGKGFALDELALTLAAYRIESALLGAGASTLLAIGPQAWPVELTGDGGTEPIGVMGCALSASGTGIQGAHVIHPDRTDPPAYAFRRVWLTASTAALADAFSTACLLMTAEEIASFAGLHRDDVTIYVEALDPSRIHRLRAP